MSVGVTAVNVSVRVVTTVEYWVRIRIRVVGEVEPLHAPRGVSMRRGARQPDAHVLLSEHCDRLSQLATPRLAVVQHQLQNCSTRTTADSEAVSKRKRKIDT